jgi:hypothetical protein
VGLQADAGGFVAIDAAADAGAQVLTLRAYTGCRPVGDASTAEPSEPPAALTAAPAALRTALDALGASSTGARVREVACPGGGVARAYTVDGVPAPGDLGRSLTPAVRGATVVRAESAGWAYRTGGDSVVITRVDAALRVTATTSCA